MEVCKIKWLEMCVKIKGFICAGDDDGGGGGGGGKGEDNRLRGEYDCVYTERDACSKTNTSFCTET